MFVVDEKLSTSLRSIDSLLTGIIGRNPGPSTALLDLKLFISKAITGSIIISFTDYLCLFKELPSILFEKFKLLYINIFSFLNDALTLF